MYHLASKNQCERSIIDVEGVRFGEGFVVIAGPCAIEDEFQMEAVTRGVLALGARMLRGGAYKPRTSPYSFQGLGDAGVTLIERVARKHGVPTVVEALAEAQLPLLRERVAMIQIGARNMQNFTLLQGAARTGKPVLLKRGPAATLDEVLYAAEYILLAGNANVVLCERGVRGFDPQMRNLFDLAGAIRLKELTHLPVIVDPSHATGRRSLIAPLVAASAAAGLDGAMIEVHPEPDAARSDGEQALNLAEFAQLMGRLGLCGTSDASKVAAAGCR